MLSDLEVMKFSIRGVCGEEVTRKFVDWRLECYDSHGIGPWALCEKESGHFIGFCGVGPESVIVIIEPEHTASVRVAEKVGFGDFTIREFHARPVRAYRISCDDWALHNKML